MVLFTPIGGAPLPTLSDALASVSVLPVAAWSEGSTLNTFERRDGRFRIKFRRLEEIERHRGR
jgi:hypothetical protein